MKYSEAKPGRIFILRLEHGDVVHEVVEQFAKDHGIRAASLIAVGGADAGSTVITGPENGNVSPVIPMYHTLHDAHEISGTGTLFPDKDGNPSLHMHLVCGRETESITGCIRTGVKTWRVMEIIIHELTGTAASRQPDPDIGFQLLEP